VAVLGWAAWQRDSCADPNVLGQRLVVGGSPVQVIGVGPMTLNSSQSNFVVASLWMPIPRIEPQRPAESDYGPGGLENRGNLFLQLRARLRDGVTHPHARLVEMPLFRFTLP
jgi:hypothetical protein